MENEFDEASLARDLDQLDFWKQLMFLISVCQRLVPSFSEFAKQTGVKGESILLSGLEKAWDILLSGNSASDLSFQQKQCEGIAPDTEDFDLILVSSALDAAVAISLLMKAFTTNDTNSIVEAASLARDSVDMYVQELENMDPNAPDLEELIVNHDLMQKELKLQREAIEFLQSLDDNQSTSMTEAKKKWFGSKGSCLGLVQ